MKNILVTGGAGYIGSHAILDLIANNYNVVIADNFSNSSPLVIKKLEELSGKTLPFFDVDIRDKNKLTNIFSTFNFDGVINFAGLKAVGESVEEPLSYYNNNVCGMINLLEVMAEYKVFNLVFSSSATVYGIPDTMPLLETNSMGAINPYARTKKIIEEILRDLAQSSDEWKIIALRYFNPLGAHKSGEIGENPNGIPNNLAPYITQVAAGKLDKLYVFGNDYDTPDGTCIRDYVHINDLASGHTAALNTLLKNYNLKNNFEAINLGSGKGYSVFEIIKNFEAVIGRTIPYEIISRRAGDLDVSLADVSKAKRLLGWEPTYSIKEMCADVWRWQEKNPNGYV
ncbi:UDP-glucose 4-epimerase GalE [Enterococcus rotai]|uniref:UDP-glucose 4-epimerase GalE n=1 Tax=Enterococcus rotai TaxID=118060 RepID=UPI0032B51BFC